MRPLMQFEGGMLRCCLMPLRSPQETFSVMASISASNTAFALELLRTLSQVNPSGNIFVSPLSISSALAMVYLGAKGDTAAQMAQVGTAGPLLSGFILSAPISKRWKLQELLC